jgi:hypothetical protein
VEVTAKPFFVQDVEHPAPPETTALACSIGHEMAQRWPHAIARIRIALSGSIAGHTDRDATGEAFLCGLSGLAERGSDPRKLAGILALNARMMAIRLNGRTLVAFTPDRDISFTAVTGGWAAGRVEARAWTARGQLLGIVQRILFAIEPAGTLPAAAHLTLRQHEAAAATST